MLRCTIVGNSVSKNKLVWLKNLPSDQEVGNCLDEALSDTGLKIVQREFVVGENVNGVIAVSNAF
jgi:hypothetical protein